MPPKFALGEALLALRDTPSDLITLDELALPYATALSRHVQHVPKQITSRSSKFLDVCARHARREANEDELRQAAVRQGFNNVIDAFHNVGDAEVGVRFFVDERSTSRGIRLTDEFRTLTEGRESASLGEEVEARWRLVETAWELGVGRPLIGYCRDDQALVVDRGHRRVNVTSGRGALNGYQKGRCFYCFAPIGVVAGAADLADVDHFVPHVLAPLLAASLDGVWNLVLACRDCNRGPGGKSDRIPDATLLARLGA